MRNMRSSYFQKSNVGLDCRWPMARRELMKRQRLYYISPEHFDVMFIDLASRSVLKLKKMRKDADKERANDLQNEA